MPAEMEPFDTSREHTSVQREKGRYALQNPYAYVNGEGGFDYPQTRVGAAGGASKVCARPDSKATPAILTPVSRSWNPPSRMELQNQYAYLNDLGEFDLPAQSRSRVATGVQYRHRFAEKSTGTLARGLSKQRIKEIETVVRRLQRELWKLSNRKDPFAVLDPALAAQYLGFSYTLEDNLTAFSVGNATHETAGIIDRRDSTIQISRRLPIAVRRFTAAHEIGHAVLHDHMTMHRDRPLDGHREERENLDLFEREADVFAALFLMPTKLLNKEFEDRFGILSGLKITDDFAFNLSPTEPQAVFKAKQSGKLALEKMLATADYFGGHRFMSLTEQFSVSATAMAIRLRELTLAG
ncbi:MAG: ImmA/IrrE family metallo-endopeptidase [Polynucleobacter sp.]|nr:ImmA/IrrE family metallo-endopeptidase [Polynucleobacter sp.]